MGVIGTIQSLEPGENLRSRRPSLPGLRLRTALFQLRELPEHRSSLPSRPGRTGKESLPFTLVFRKQTLFFSCASLRRRGRCFPACVYICSCVYIGTSLPGLFIASMLLAVCHFTALPAPTTQAPGREQGQASPECVFKGVQAPQLLFW